MLSQKDMGEKESPNPYVSVEKKTETRPQSVSSQSTRHGHALNNSWKDVSGIFGIGVY